MLKNMTIPIRSSNTDLEPTNTNIEIDYATGVHVTRNSGYINGWVWRKKSRRIQSDGAEGIFGSVSCDRIYIKSGLVPDLYAGGAYDKYRWRM